MVGISTIAKSQLNRVFKFSILYTSENGTKNYEVISYILFESTI